MKKQYIKLPKLRVASSSLVCRSIYLLSQLLNYLTDRMQISRLYVIV